MMSGLSLSLLILAFTISISEADYEFTIHFYEFRNPLGLQCGECGSGGSPACCDDVQQKEPESCTNEAPFTCDTRFRFLLRPFGASVETAPIGGFPHITPSNGSNNEIFIEGPGGFLALANPFTITNTTAWTGNIQFFIDALDSDVRSGETEVLINRFPIDLKLELGAAFTARVNYTGIYNISDLGFDISFRVQCSQNYYGPNCTTFCESMEGVYTCDSEGRILCLSQFTGENCSGTDVALLAGTVGGAGAILIVILLILCVVIMVVVKVKKRGKHCNTTIKEETYDDVSTKNSQTLQLQMKAATVDTSNAYDRDVDNPLYTEPDGKDSATIELKNGNQMQSSSRCGVTAPSADSTTNESSSQVYTVAYPVLTPKADSSAASVDGYERLYNVH